LEVGDSPERRSIFTTRALEERAQSSDLHGAAVVEEVDLGA
jgi:hypothetical protein